jgi:hypothetical protein
VERADHDENKNESFHATETSSFNTKISLSSPFFDPRLSTKALAKDDPFLKII